VANARVGALQIVSGVYFLLDRGNVVYVGQSRDVFMRVRRHYADPAKPFDSWAYLECDIADLAERERVYIEMFQPYLNLTIVRKQIRRRPHRQKEFIVHPTGLYDNIIITDKDRLRATEAIASILRPNP